jgi:hypothetical protein
MDVMHALMHWSFVILAGLLLVIRVGKIGLGSAFRDPVALLSLALTLFFVRGVVPSSTSFSLAVFTLTWLILVYVIVTQLRGERGAGGHA